MVTGSAAGSGPVGRHLHEPAPRARSTSASPGTASRSATTSSPSELGAIAAVEAAGRRCTPSYFEILTAAAFRWFADVAVDVAVVEVGLLGRYDATNVADAQVAVVTNVGHDHTDGVGPAGGPASPARRPASSSRAATLVLGETDPELAAVFAADGPGGGLAARRRLRLRGEPLAVGGRLRRPAHAGRLARRRATSRCTARTRATTPRSPSPRRRRSSVGRSTRRS